MPLHFQFPSGGVDRLSVDDNREGPIVTVQYYTSGEVAPRVSLSRPELLYLIESGQIPGPSIRVPGRRLYTDDDIRRIVEALAARKKEQK